MWAPPDMMGERPEVWVYVGGCMRTWVCVSAGDGGWGGQKMTRRGGEGDRCNGHVEFFSE